MATCGRHRLAERSLRLFMNQQHDPEKDHLDIFHLLIYNNSNVDLKLDPSLWENEENAGYKSVQLVNQHISKRTGEPYTNLGDIYNDALEYIPDTTDVIVHWDDDDLFLPNHIMEGVKGLQAAMIMGKEAYKPAQSYYRHPGGVQLMSNTLEPSIFVTTDHLLKHKYGLSTTDQHLQWVNPLVYEQKILVDDHGTPTLIYNWGDTDIPTFKTSGNAGHPNNFNNYRNFSKDHGDQILTPWKKEEVQKYYDLVHATATSQVHI